jgi:hypothetical protein
MNIEQLIVTKVLLGGDYPRNRMSTFDLNQQFLQVVPVLSICGIRHFGPLKATPGAYNPSLLTLYLGTGFIVL